MCGVLGLVNLEHLIYSMLSLSLSLLHSASVVIGAPKANTRQVNVTEGGSVFYCPWSLSQSDCHTIEFDTEGKPCIWHTDKLCILVVLGSSDIWDILVQLPNNSVFICNFPLGEIPNNDFELCNLTDTALCLVCLIVWDWRWCLNSPKMAELCRCSVHFWSHQGISSLLLLSAAGLDQASVFHSTELLLATLVPGLRDDPFFLFVSSIWGRKG